MIDASQPEKEIALRIRCAIADLNAALADAQKYYLDIEIGTKKGEPIRQYEVRIGKTILL